MNPVFFRIGSFEIRYYGLMYAIAFLLGIHLAKKAGKKKGLDPMVVENWAFVAMISGLLGGRLYYVLFNLPYYLAYPAKIPAVWEGGMAIHGGIIGGLIGTWIYCKIKGLNTWTMGDLAAAPFILGQAIGRFGNLMNGEVHGVPTFTPWSKIFTIKPQALEWFKSYQGMALAEKAKFKELVPWGIVFPGSSPAGQEFPNLPLHPAMLYEMGLNFLGFLAIWFFFSRKGYKSGVVWWIYVIMYCTIRIFVSFFRAEDLMINGIRGPHLISLILIAISLLFIKFLPDDRSKETA